MWKEIKTTLDICWIFLTEYFIHFFSQNSNSFLQILAIKLSEKNILYVKLFQMFASHYKYIDSDSKQNIFFNFTNNAPYKEKDVDYNALWSVLDKNKLNIDKLRIINSGMISLVYRYEGEKVFKIKRKNIEQDLKEAITHFRFIINLFSYIPCFFSLLSSLSFLFEQNIKIIEQQINFETEVENLIQFQETCFKEKMDYVQIPTVYRDNNLHLKNKNVIVMEYLEGIPFEKLSEEERKLFAEYVVRFGLDSLLKLELIHGDLHAGNILFLKKKDEQNTNTTTTQYKLGVIDFGIVYRMDPAFKEQGMNLGFNFFFLKQSSREIAKQLLEIVLIKTEYWEEKEFLMDNISEMLDNFLEGKENILFKIMGLLEKLANLFHPHYLEKHGFILHPDFYHLQLAMAMTHGITLELCGEQNYIELVEQVWNKYYQL